MCSEGIKNTHAKCTGIKHLYYPTKIRYYFVGSKAKNAAGSIAAILLIPSKSLTFPVII